MHRHGGGSHKERGDIGMFKVTASGTVLAISREARDMADLRNVMSNATADGL